MRKLLERTGCAAAVLLILGCGKRDGERVVNVYNWSDYIAEGVIEQFTTRTGIKVNYDTYDSNEALEAKLQSGVADYDVVAPSDYMVRRLVEQKLVQPLDHGQLPDLVNLSPKFLNAAFDTGNKHSVPYFWGTTGIGYDKSKITEPVESWKVLFDEKYAGRILMLDDMRECFAVALKMLGKSVNETDPEALRQAADLLKQQKKLVKTYNSGDFQNILLAGDVDFAHGWNGQLAEAVAEAPERLAYVIPKEGGVVWMDNLCVPATARNVEEAHAFINFMMDPEVAAANVNEVAYAGPNEAAKQFIKEAILNDPSIYPSNETLVDLEFLDDIGDAVTVMDRFWTEIKAQ